MGYKDDGRFGLTKNEALFSRVSYKRLMAIVRLKDVVVINMGRSENSYGEFLFITLYSPEVDALITLYSCGFHRYRERWFVDEWYFYTTPGVHALEKAKTQAPLNKTACFVQIGKEYSIAQKSKAKHIREKPRSERAVMFEELADTADDDVAIAMMGDIGI